MFVVPKFRADYANGGAENICRLICITLSKQYDVTVLHSESDRERKLGKFTFYNENLKSCNAFYLDGWTKKRGEVVPDFCDEALNCIRKSKFVLSFERCLANIKIPQICVLGGISYQHCQDIAKSKIWDKLIVPSNFIKKQCASIRGDEENIIVVYNGIVCEKFYGFNEKCSNCALLPFIPDLGKGFYEAIDFVKCANEIGKWGQFHILITRLENSTFSDDGFYEKIEEYATKENVLIKYVPWCSEDEMNEVYNSADFVLSLGSLEEGFGLTTIESILAGRFVVARKIGATPEILPKNAGVLFMDIPVNRERVLDIMNTIKSEQSRFMIKDGGIYIKNHYDLAKMQNDFCAIVDKYMI